MDAEKSSYTELNALTDIQLWQAVTQGQAEALGQLYDRHASLVYGTALKILQNPQEAEDLTQDIFVRLPKLAYDPKRGSLRTFLGIFTRSRALDQVRSRQRELHHKKQLSQHNSSILETNLAEESLSDDQAKEVISALSQLPEEQSKLLKMSYYDGLTQAKIAERLNLPIGTVKSRVRRGLIQLRQLLKTP